MSSTERCMPLTSPYYPSKVHRIPKPPFSALSTSSFSCPVVRSSSSVLQLTSMADDVLYRSSVHCVLPELPPQLPHNSQYIRLSTASRIDAS